MERMACVDLPALPLQILLHSHTDWADAPVAVVDRDKPLGLIEWVNRRARACRITPGMRYAAGLSLSRELRAGVVTGAAIGATIDRLTQALWRFSPRIEASEKEPGVFWLDASGLLPLYPSLPHWSSLVRDELRRSGFHAVVAIGFSRFGSYAAARAGTTNIVFRDAAHEQAHLRVVPLERLGLSPKTLDTLLKLGIDTLGRFIALPSSGIRRRFGPEAQALHRLASGAGWAPLEPRPLLEPPERSACFDHPETGRERLLAFIEPLLVSILLELSGRHEALAALQLDLKLDDGNERREQLMPAEPTLDAQQLFGLLRLRLETLTLSSGAVELTLSGTGIPTSRRQLALFREAPRRNLEAAQRAFAKIRAELGNDAVVHARLHDGHLPEACFGWESLERLAAPKPAGVALRPLVRRLFSPPIELPARSRHEPDGWFIARFSDGPVEEVIGPHIVSGGWWTRETTRAYHYVRTRSGRWLWIYNDRRRRRWFLHGEVE